MNLNINLEELQHQCRICLQQGDVNIWNCKVTVKTEADIQANSLGMDDSIEKTFLELMDIFYDSQDLLNLTDEFPSLCWPCLEDLKYCYIFYEKIKLANIQLANLYQESLNQCIEEEHLIEVVEDKDLKEITEINPIETMEEDKLLQHFPPYTINETNQLHTLSKPTRSKHIPLDKNDAFVITQFVPETLDTNEINFTNQNKEDDEECQPPQHLLTVNLKAVEVKNLHNLETPQPLDTDSEEPAVYICQYCPQAFAKSDYLKTHIQKSHVCKFCTQTFSITEDLFKHIREVHTEHKCAICHKLLSSHTNLRHHIRRVHRIQLPAKVTLLDFIKSTNVEESMPENDVEILQELGATEMDFNTQYVWQNDDCIEMFGENNSTEMN
ncbi:zinc finger protein 639 [Calliphora vicina]|uniref:zinc finger protein 639 n=1 Tax=Calliphora vicina TaxID=7373 RepID=UPI00325BFD72